MTEISEAAKARADAMLKEADTRGDIPPRPVAYWITETLARYIQQVSDEAAGIVDLYGRMYGENERGQIVARALAPFILPEPVDPLEEALRAMWADRGWNWPISKIADLRAELAKRGLKIVETK